MFRVALGALLVTFLYAIYRYVYVAVGGVPDGAAFSAERYQDSILLYALIPGYFLAASGFCRSRSDVAYARLSEGLASRDAYAHDLFVRPRWVLAGALAGLVYGVMDMASSGETRNAVILEWTLKIGNGAVWASIGAIFSWRFCYARLFQRMGDAVRVNLLNMESLKPLGRVASFDVFVVMGAMAMMPLQSFSSDFNWEYYQAGFAFGIPAALAFLILPQLGAHRNIRRAKQQKLRELEGQITATRVQDIGILEPLLAHRDRIEDLPEWPIDTRTLSRAVLYLIVPPLAWVGAAIVERGVEQII